MFLRRNFGVALLTVVGVLVAGCGGSTAEEVEDAKTTAEQVTTTEAETTTTAAPTTTQPPTTTTTELAFSLDDLDEFDYHSTNYTCGWATDAPPLPNAVGWSLDLDRLTVSLQIGEEIEPFLNAVEGMDVDLSNIDEIKTALAEACVGIGAPTDEWLADPSG